MMKELSSPLCLTLLENNPTFIVVIDKEKSIYWLNQSFCDFLGVEREDVIGQSAANAQEPCLQQVLNASIRVELFAGILDKWIELQDVMMIQEPTSGEEITVCFYSDASNKIQAEKQLLQLETTLTHKMSHDPVTGMLSHHSMFQTLNSEVSRSRRYNNPLSLILMNVDYNLDADDSDMPEKKDQIRVMISQLLKDQMRWADIVGHLDEFDFVLLLPETNKDSSEVLVKKLQHSLQDAALDTITISYGVSQWRKGDDVRLFLGRAVEDLNSEIA